MQFAELTKPFVGAYTPSLHAFGANHDLGESIQEIHVVHS